MFCVSLSMLMCWNWGAAVPLGRLTWPVERLDAPEAYQAGGAASLRACWMQGGDFRSLFFTYSVLLSAALLPCGKVCFLQALTRIKPWKIPQMSVEVIRHAATPRLMTVE